MSEPTNEWDGPGETPGVPDVSRVVLIGKTDCHLCEDARELVARVCAELGESWQERDILGDPALADEWWEQVPVVLVDDHVVGYWRISEDRLRAALRPA